MSLLPVKARRLLRRFGMASRQGAPGPAAGIASEDLQAAMDEIVSAVPEVRAASDYRHRLKEAAAGALTYAGECVATLGEPVAFSREAFKTDPLVNALFTSHDDYLAFLRRSRGQEDCAAATDCFFLLTMVRQESHVMTTERVGDLGAKSAICTADTFVDHRMLALAPDLAECRRRAALHLVRTLAGTAESRLGQDRARREELERSRAMLKAQVRAIEEEAGDEPAAERALLEKRVEDARRELETVEADLERLRRTFSSYDDVLQAVQRVLSDPRPRLRVERKTLRLDPFGIERSEDSSEECHIIAFTELVVTRPDGEERRAAVLAEARS